MTDAATPRIVVPEAEFGRMLAAAYPKLRVFAKYLTKRHELGEDLAQDVMLKAVLAREQFAAGTNLSAWLCMIARNRWYSDRRRAWRMVEMADGQAERVPIAAGQMMRLELSEALDAMSYLPPEHAEALLAAAEGLTMEEMASELGVAEGTVKSRISRARTSLKTFFGD